MSTNKKFRIIGGPDFRSFVVASDIVAGTGSNVTFKFDKDSQPVGGFLSGRTSSFCNLTLTLLAIGKYYGPKNQDDDDKCNFSFIASYVTISTAYILIGNYNTHTRTGSCEMIPRGQFFGENPAMKLIFPHLVFSEESPASNLEPGPAPSVEIS